MNTQWLMIQQHITSLATFGERSSYVLELILALRRQGWLWTEEFIWHKKNSFPGKWPNRFRDAWERLLQFNRQKKFNMYQDTIKVSMNVSTRRRLQRLRDADKTLTPSQSGSPFKRNLANWQNKDSAYPDNVLYLGTDPTIGVIAPSFRKPCQPGLFAYLLKNTISF
jgi:site-specific DNA-methyltransferase (adenine-specific)